MSSAALNNGALTALADRGWDTPRYPRDGEPGVVHLGLGGFHRAHQAMVFDRLLRAGDLRWGVTAVGMRQTRLADSLAAQQGLYALGQSGPDGTRWNIMGSIWRTAVTAREPQAVQAALAAPATRWVTLTVTEKGYGPELARMLVDALATRRSRALAGLTLASCDNQRGNGDALRLLCRDAARSHGTDLVGWMESACAFPNSMVDRIVPTPTDELAQQANKALGLRDAAPVGTETFWEWVIEDRFAESGDAAALAGAGVRVVQDVRPYEDAKLRMLNGSHSAMACMGVVLGLEHVHEAVADAGMRRFLHGFYDLDVGPGLGRPDWTAYRDALLTRFENPALCHRLHQICSDTSQKIAQRWVPAALDALSAGRQPRHLALAAASWMRYLRGVDEAGVRYSISDPMGAELQTLAERHAGDPSAGAAALGAVTAIWGEELPRHRVWMEAVAQWLRSIDSAGLRATIAALDATPNALIAKTGSP
jgi:fructuronate reductase